MKTKLFIACFAFSQFALAAAPPGWHINTSSTPATCPAPVTAPASAPVGSFTWALLMAFAR
jgi:hypothetical protein